MTGPILLKPTVTNLVKCTTICRVAWEYGIKQDCYRIEQQTGDNKVTGNAMYRGSTQSIYIVHCLDESFID